jgi:malate dehydrogenase (oxaloacetate-decarboxylating)(NADP+)
MAYQMPASERAHGVELLRDPATNKGTAFTCEERDQLGLRGLLPPRVFTIEEQRTRVLENVRRKTSNLEKYIFLVSLQERNQTLFYNVVLNQIQELMPIIYTPTVGQACLEYGHIFRRAQGLYVSIEDRGHVTEIINNWHEDDVRVVVVTDGERILGLGDLGADGMGIPVGKLSLYTACAGIDPSKCLPVTVDVGTNNPDLLNDPLYIGMPHQRVRGADYDALVDEFVTAVLDRYPRALIQFEDFGNQNAFRLLAKYRDNICSFNDDIQGTASVTLAGLYSSLRISGKSLTDQTILFLGAGEAGIGIGDLIASAMQAEGLSEEEARRRCWFMDSKGLVVSSRTDLAAHKLPYAHEHAFIADLLEAVETLRPTALIGVSGMPQTFTQPVVEAMARLNERPVVFALSNPTSKSECTAEQAYTWSEGRAIYASGSPFDPVTFNGQKFVPGQANNSYIFPGVGLGVVASHASVVTDEMFFVAAKTLAQQVTEADLETGATYPPLSKIRDVSLAIATAVAEVAFERGLAGIDRPRDLSPYIQAQMYVPEY